MVRVRRPDLPARARRYRPQLLFCCRRHGRGTSSGPRLYAQDEIDAAVAHLARSCEASRVVGADDDYALASNTPGAPVFRGCAARTGIKSMARTARCWEKLDASRRTYRWLYGALHTLDFPVLTARPALRTGLIVALCGCGFVFQPHRRDNRLAKAAVLLSLGRTAVTGKCAYWPLGVTRRTREAIGRSNRRRPRGCAVVTVEHIAKCSLGYRL